MSLILVDINAKRANCLCDYPIVSSDEHSIGGTTEGTQIGRYPSLEVSEKKSCYSEILHISENMGSDGSVAHGRPGGDLSLCPVPKKKKNDGTSHSDREDPSRCEPSTYPDWPWA